LRRKKTEGKNRNSRGKVDLRTGPQGEATSNCRSGASKENLRGNSPSKEVNGTTSGRQGTLPPPRNRKRNWGTGCSKRTRGKNSRSGSTGRMRRWDKGPTRTSKKIKRVGTNEPDGRRRGMGGAGGRDTEPRGMILAWRRARSLQL